MVALFNCLLKISTETGSKLDALNVQDLTKAFSLGPHGPALSCPSAGHVVAVTPKEQHLFSGSVVC